MISISREKSASMKGLLMCLIIMGHNHYFVSAFSIQSYDWLYSFHVACFFILPFLYEAHSFSWFRFWTNMKRLFWPYTIMFIFLFLIRLLSKNADLDIGLVDTWITGNIYALKTYTGFQYLWFLPAMVSMLTIKDMYVSASKGGKWGILGAGVIFFVFFWLFLYNRPWSSSINHFLAKLSILSFMMGFAMFFLGWFTKLIIVRYLLPSWLLVLGMLMFLIAMLLTSNTVYYDFIRWGARAVCPIMFFALLFKHSDVYNCSFLNEIGRLSLPIYLFHQPINVVVCSLANQFELSSSLMLLISFSIILGASFFVSRMVYSIKGIRGFLFPR